MVNEKKRSFAAYLYIVFLLFNCRHNTWGKQPEVTRRMSYKLLVVWSGRLLGMEKQTQPQNQTAATMGIRKGVAFRKLGRTTAHKMAMLKNMVTSLVKHERIVTTLPKAKELRHLADQVVTLTKKTDRLHGIRMADAIIQEKPVLTKLFEVLGPRYEKRQGGYTRILKLAQKRKGDGAEMAVMEYVDRPGELRAARPPASVQKELLAKITGPLKDDEISALTDGMDDLAFKGDMDELTTGEADKGEELEPEEVQEDEEGKEGTETESNKSKPEGNEQR
jgi:large subunit ribosomal protein L17